MDLSNVEQIYSNKELRIKACEDSLFLFVMFYFPHVMERLPADFHEEMCNIYDDEELKRVLFLMFRESAKTVFAKYKFVQNICYRKRRFQIYCCYDKVKARAHLFDIARYLQTNERIINDFGQLFFEDTHKKQSTRKSIGEFITKNDVKCLAFSIGESPRGLVYGSSDGEFRPDYWVLDDIDVLKAVENREVVDKSWEWFTNELLPGVSKDARVVFLGNRLKRDGVIPRLEEKIGISRKVIERGYGIFNKGGWVYYNTPAIIENDITWKDRFAMNKTEALPHQEWLYGKGGKMEDYGSTAFESQMLNRIAKEDRIFDTSKIDIFTEMPNISSMNIFMTSDLAISEKKSADETVHIVVGVDKNNHIWVLDVFNGRVLPEESIDNLFKLHQKWKPMQYGLETVGFQKSMKYAIEDRQRAQSYYFGVEELKSAEKKYERILGLQPHVELGKLHINRDMSILKQGSENILSQLKDFPYGKHDDIIDALAYVLQLAFPVYN